MSTAQIWIAALVTIALWFWLYDKKSPVFEMAQYLYIGLSFAYGIAIEYSNYLQPNLALIGKGHWTLVIPILIGLLLYLRFVKSVDYLARWSLAFFIGYGAGYVLAFQPAIFLGQLTGSFYQLWGNKTSGISLNNWISLILLLATVAYFFFTVRRDRGAVRSASQLGRYAIMVAFGTTFGAQILFRYTLLFGRVYFIFHNWLHVV